MAAAQKVLIDVELLPMEQPDLVEVANRCFEAFPTFYAPMEPELIRPPHDVRCQRFANRLSKLLRSPHILATKAVLASGPEKGKLAGLTIWHRPDAPEVFNLKRAWKDESKDDEENWEGVDKEKWEAKWGEWDQIRERIMDGIPHWYIAPLIVIPGYQGQGIGSKLLKQVTDLADSHTPTQPIYLEASAAGKPMYEKIGFRVEGDVNSEYPELVRWNKDGRTREEWKKDLKQ
ncbi:hypothetical protein JCM8547_000699 [Rhodosporidiobolus lusitaniae]